MKKRLDFLNGILSNKKNSDLGLEGWFRLELLHALIEKGDEPKVRNVGIDIEFDDGIQIELKAPLTTSLSWIGFKVRKHEFLYDVPLLFLGKSDFKKKLEERDDRLLDDLKIDVEIRDINECWIVGMLTPKSR